MRVPTAAAVAMMLLATAPPAGADPVDDFVDAMLGLAGPVEGFAQALVGALPHPDTAGHYVGLGEGDASITSKNKTTACPRVVANVVFHPAMFNEPSLHASFQAGQGQPTLICGSGWRMTFKPSEVSGSLATGLVAHRTSPDAIIDLVVGPEGPDGARPVWSRHETIPFHDVYVVSGSVRETHLG